MPRNVRELVRDPVSAGQVVLELLELYKSLERR
jgi:hypothetical protein